MWFRMGRNIHRSLLFLFLFFFLVPRTADRLEIQCPSCRRETLIWIWNLSALKWGENFYFVLLGHAGILHFFNISSWRPVWADPWHLADAEGKKNQRSKNRVIDICSSYTIKPLGEIALTNKEVIGGLMLQPPGTPRSDGLRWEFWVYQDQTPRGANSLWSMSGGKLNSKLQQ